MQEACNFSRNRMPKLSHSKFSVILTKEIAILQNQWNKIAVVEFVFINIADIDTTPATFLKRCLQHGGFSENTTKFSTFPQKGLIWTPFLVQLRAAYYRVLTLLSGQSHINSSHT